MTNTKHTPGPWKIEPELYKYYFQITSESGRKIASCHAGSARHTDEQSDQLCQNARLIAAAPDYDDGARDFVAYEEAMTAGNDVEAMALYDSASRKLRAAMAKVDAKI